MCVLSIKVPTRKKSGNLFNDPRNCVETTAILQCKQISFNSFQIESTNKLLTNKSHKYTHLNVFKQMINIK